MTGGFPRSSEGLGELRNGGIKMFGFSIADWIFIGLVMGVIFLCVALSGMNKRKN
jgi:hypothetical protein